MKTKFCLLTAIFGYFLMNGYSQKREFKFGKIDNAELAATRCPIDSTADAYVICDIGSTRFEYNDSKGYFVIIFERYVRVKILRKSAFENTTVVIPLYKTTRAEEQVDGLKGNTYNLENGKPVISKLDIQYSRNLNCDRFKK